MMKSSPSSCDPNQGEEVAKQTDCGSPPEAIREQSSAPLNISSLKGRYAEIRVKSDELEKRNYIEVEGGIGASAREAVKRAEDVKRYHAELLRAGVTCPETLIEVDLTSYSLPAVVIHSQKIPMPHNLVQIARSPWEERLVRIDEMIHELLKVVQTHTGERPIGYDTGLDNFVSWKGRCYLVDMYPPRLGFDTTPEGATSNKAKDTLLINYPERDDLSAERSTQMRRFYYTPQGSIEHFSLWAISAALYDIPRHDDSPEFTQRYREVVDRIRSSLEKAGRKDLSHHLEQYLRSDSGLEQLAYNYTRTALRIEKSLKQFSQSCHLY